MKIKVIHTTDIFPFIKAKLLNTKDQLIIVSAFVKVEALKKIDNYAHANLEKILLVRFRKVDIISRSTDLELFEYCENNGWKLFFNFDIHSKIFVFDRLQYFIGSSNVTLSGLGLSDEPNIESGVTGKFELEDYKRILKFLDISELMTKEIMAEFKKQLSSTTIDNNFSEWDLRELNLFKKDNFKILWVSDFLTSPSPLDIKSSDLKLLGITREESFDKKLLKEKFINLKCYKWLINEFDKEIYFGSLTAKLHNTLIDDPRPYRKDVKTLLSNLLNWIVALKIEGIIIERPNHSQRIRKIGFK